MRHQRRARPAVSSALAVVLMVACTGDDTSTNTTESQPTTAAAVPTPDDGVLTLAVVVPDAGRGAPLGSSLAAGARLAADEIAAAGGVLGRPIRVVMRSESDDPGTMAATFRSLVDDGVDAIVGPASSTVTLATLRSAVDVGLVVCSPTASALALDEYPDGGLLVRTVPSDSLQALALAREVEQTGGRTAVVVHLDDEYGRPFADATVDALRDTGIEVLDTIAFDASEESTRRVASDLVDRDPDAIVVIADVDGGTLLINAVNIRDPRATFVVNDAQRRPEQTAAFLDGRVTGVAPAASVVDEAFRNKILALDADAVPWYAANAYDCVNLLALAATAAGTSIPVDVARQVRSVSTSGTRCRDYASCAAGLADDRNVDYDGPDDDLDIGADGDPIRARFETFGFDQAGVDRTTGSFVVGR